MNNTYCADTEEDIQLCLNCEKERCDNCLDLKRIMGEAFDHRNINRTKQSPPKRIDQLTPDGRLVKTWERRSEIVKALGLTEQETNAISRSCRRGGRIVLGYKWIYHKEGSDGCSIRRK